MATDGLTSTLTTQALAMASHALRAGLDVPGWVLDAIAAADAESNATLNADVLRAHEELVGIVAPFTPDLVVTLDRESAASPFWQALGPIRLARAFSLVLAGSLISFVALALSHEVKDPKHGDIVTELFLLSAAAVGASFINLFQMNREIATGTFAPANRASYGVSLILGLVAGLLLAEVVPAPPWLPFGAASLALLGGFASSALQQTAQRLIDTLEAVLHGGAELERRARDVTSQRDLDEAVTKHRVQTTTMLADVRRRLAAGEKPEALRALVAKAGRAEPSH